MQDATLLSPQGLDVAALRASTSTASGTAEVALRGKDAARQVLATVGGEDGSERDLSREVRWTVEPATLASVDRSGRVKPLSDGIGKLVATTKDGANASLRLSVAEIAAAAPIHFANQIVPIFTSGKLKPDSVIAQGTAPNTVSFVEGPGSTKFAKGQTGWFTMIPTIYNADTLGIRPDLVGRKIENWKDILDPKFKGKTSILNIPSIGIMDAAMICESAGIVKYGDKGNMTKAEIDKTIDFLIKTKKEGQFRAFWKTFDESVNLMTSGEVVIQSMWSPAVSAVRAKGVPCVYQPLKEGYRAWGGGLSLAKHLQGAQLDAAYEYINWYLSGWVGAFLNRQGYYSAVLETAKANMSADEWGFWMEGKPAIGDIKNPQGVVVEKAGAVRDGGSFYDRMGAVACWNAGMDEDRYMVQKWNQFIAA